MYAHQHYDYPTIDAIDYFRPAKVDKFTLNKNVRSYYTMEMETNIELGTSDSPCDDNLEYSYSKERIDQLCLERGLISFLV